jgi:hypothetical protein
MAAVSEQALEAIYRALTQLYPTRTFNMGALEKVLKGLEGTSARDLMLALRQPGVNVGSSLSASLADDLGYIAEAYQEKFADIPMAAQDEMRAARSSRPAAPKGGAPITLAPPEPAPAPVAAKAAPAPVTARQGLLGSMAPRRMTAPKGLMPLAGAGARSATDPLSQMILHPTQSTQGRQAVQQLRRAAKQPKLEELLMRARGTHEGPTKTIRTKMIYPKPSTSGMYKKRPKTGGMIGKAILNQAKKAAPKSATRGALRAIGKGAGKIGAGAIGWPLLGAIEGYGLYSTAKEGSERAKKAAAIEAQPVASSEDYLRAIRMEEMLAARQARLARSDPEAYDILTRTLRGKTVSPRMAVGEFMVGGSAGTTQNVDQQVQEVLAALTQGG